MKSKIIRNAFILILFLSFYTNENLTILSYADTNEDVQVKANNDLFSKDVYNFKVTMLSNNDLDNISIQGLKNGLLVGEVCKLNVFINNEEYKNVQWNNLKSNGVVINNDGYLTAISSGKSNINGSILDENNNELGTIELTFYIKGNINKVGWIRNNETWYYMQPDSNTLKTKWLKYNNNWYCFDDNAAMKTGWVSDHGNTYYLKQYGEMARGWFKDSDSWYYANQDGTLKTGWHKDHGNTYYLNEDGKMQTSEKEIDGVCYNFKQNGELIK